MHYSDERNNLQQAETCPGLGRGRGCQQQHRLQVCRQLEKWRGRKHAFRKLLGKGQGNGKGRWGGEGEEGELR
jgi:hypothetical protein